MKLYYISPSVLPSRSANSIHVIHQCSALQKFQSINITLFAIRSISNSKIFKKIIESSYDVNLNAIRLATFQNRVPFGNNIFICFFSLYYLYIEKMPDVIISRNLYASFVIAVLLRRKIFYETHELEIGIYKLLQKLIIAQPHVTTIVISKILKKLMVEHHNMPISNIQVLHDAAPEGLRPLKIYEKKNTLKKLFPEENLVDYNFICGYFGHLYPGRGIEVIFELAKRNKKHAFLIVGGNDADIEKMKIKYPLENLFFLGFVSHSKAQKFMASCDVLLMPYQSKVSIGKKNRDTSRWMSPMKMFEYLGSGTPIVSSDLPVLKEVLINEKNALLVPPNDINAWNHAIDRLQNEPGVAEKLGKNGYDQYIHNHTWLQRAQNYLDILKFS